MLNVEKKLDNGVLLIALEGELDTLSSPDFEDMLEPLLDEAQSLTLDFEKLEYISSAGLRVLLAAEQALEEKGAEKVRVVNMNSTIRNIFEITGFVDVLAVE
ncbi:MAG: STAS domain-containing protein [Ruminococcaceae bacterium]|nr:STAS domain-containing protein [Oscillospiraceae bacterium]